MRMSNSRSSLNLTKTSNFEFDFSNLQMKTVNKKIFLDIDVELKWFKKSDHVENLEYFEDDFKSRRKCKDICRKWKVLNQNKL